jgi:vancomycin resistance protein VanJ
LSRIPRWLAPAALAPAAALDAAWALGINGPPAHVIAQTLALPAHAAALAALPAAALAPGRRARQLNAAAALALLGTGVGLLAGDWGGGPRPGDATLTVYSANLEFERSDVSANIEEMLAAGCDVAVFQEVTPDYLRQLRAGLEGCYTEVVSTSRNDALGAAMFGRVEVRNATIESAAGSPTPSADVVAGDGTVVRVLGVHTTPPIHGVGPWTAQHDRLAAMAREADRVVVAGDFNASGRHQPMRQLVAGGHLRDAHREVGQGLGLTWPARLPIARLDRVLFRGLEPLSLSVGCAAGSDHRPVTARFSTAGRRVSAVVEKVRERA